MERHFQNDKRNYKKNKTVYKSYVLEYSKTDMERKPSFYNS